MLLDRLHAVAQKLLRTVPARLGQSCVDFGCGHSNSSIPLASLVSCGREVCALDKDRSAPEWLPDRTPAPENITTVQRTALLRVIGGAPRRHTGPVNFRNGRCCHLSSRPIACFTGRRPADQAQPKTSEATTPVGQLPLDAIPPETPPRPLHSNVAYARQLNPPVRKAYNHDTT